MTAPAGTVRAAAAPLPPLAAPGPAPRPDVATLTADSGLRVVAARGGAVPLVELRLVIPFDGGPAPVGATAELLAATLLGGTRAHGRAALDDRLAEAGAQLTARIDPERLVLSGSAPADGLPRLLDVLADSLTGPAFTAADLAEQRARLRQRIDVARRLPKNAVREALLLRCYGAHPLTRETPGSALVAAVEDAAVRELARERLVPRGATLVVVGSADPARTAELAARALAGWRSERTATAPTAPGPVRGTGLGLLPRPGARQAQVRLAAAALPRTDPGYEALLLANLVLGGYFSSRLVAELRERRGWVYHAQSTVEEHSAGDALAVIGFDTDTRTAGAALRAARDELAGIAGPHPPTDREIEDARSYAAGITAVSLSGQRGLAHFLLTLETAGLDHHWLPEHLDRLRAVGPDAVRAAAARHFAPDRFTGVLAGDPGALTAEDLAAFPESAVPEAAVPEPAVPEAAGTGS
ncbi:M16 family metallopeptidase [Kitasatospora sp. NPDC088391]|uniref:M16 family metallopeptidase n=1 Tax=Kitasatospora sp. NPDC088391 TaxID=3364074 RepID=UPI0037F92375